MKQPVININIENLVKAVNIKQLNEEQIKKEIVNTVLRGLLKAMNDLGEYKPKFKPNKKEAINQLNLLIRFSKELISELESDKEDLNEQGACLASLDIINDKIQELLIGKNIDESDETINISMSEYKRLKLHEDFTNGLYVIDRNPNEVSYEWIKKNAFQLTDAKGT